jgi:predicted AAA+ superfamily ATPase
MKPYFHRALEPELSRVSAQFPVTVLTGPRQTGKSTLLTHLFPRYRYISFDDIPLRTAAIRDPGLFVETLDYPVIIDELQYAPGILPYIKLHVDRDRVNGRFILTGSQIFNLSAGVSESLAGRACLFELLPFSFAEMERSGLRAVPGAVRDCYRRIVQGFYPVPVIENTDTTAFYSAYLALYLERDLRQIKNIGDLTVFENFLRLLAGRAGNLLNIADLARDCGIAHATAKTWLSLLESSRILYLLRPYSANMGKRLVKSPKIYFTDTGLLCYLLKFSSGEALMDSGAAGAVFENMIIVEALKQKLCKAAPEELYFYRDSNGVEVDLALDRPSGLELYEIKSAKTLRPAMAASLNRTSLKAAGKTLLSFYENTLPLAPGVTAIPWWKFAQGG